MTHVFLHLPEKTSAGGFDGFAAGIASLEKFKGAKITDTVRTNAGSVAVAPASKYADKRVIRSEDGQISIVDIGTWMPLPATGGADGTWLISEYRKNGAPGLARRLQGLFALFIIDNHRGQAHVITDRCGSLHVYHTKLSDGYAVCTSSAVLALCEKRTLDPVGLHEFVATGILYEDRSLWDGVKKLGPASVLALQPGRQEVQTYWTFSEVDSESLDLEDAVEKAHHALVSVLRSLPASEKSIVSDLTGGYDSRFLLTGLLESGREFSTTVSGPSEHPDVLVASQIASVVGLRHSHVAAKGPPSAETFDTALRMTDGEYDAFDYARILVTHDRLSAQHGMSLNGSFGELARGYWWELLWPHLADSRPLDTAMVARKRFAAIGYDKSLFSPAAKLDLADHMHRVAARAIQPIAKFPNTSQMDCVYYTLRMQRWQGRIASSTNQLWPSFSPIGFAQVLEPILASRAETRFRSLFVRRYFERFAPALSQIPLEHGYPPAPVSLANFWRFTPVIGHYGGKVREKLMARLMGKRSGTGAPPPRFSERPENVELLEKTGLREWLKAPALLETGFFKPELLLPFLTPDRPAPSGQVDQWRRLVTVEYLLRKLG